MLAVELKGGLGNLLFQIAAGEAIAAETGRTFCITKDVSPKTIHTTKNYFTSVLANWSTCPRLLGQYRTIFEPSFARHDWSGLQPRNVCLDGYFQNWRYISPGFTDRLLLPTSPPLNGGFLHIRGGDYLNNYIHDVGLFSNYYQRAIEHFPSGTHFYVFTNDIPYAKSLGVLERVPHTFIESDEVTSLVQMAACTEGGICANSSFSWWGAYLNPKRTIVMPDKWFNDPNIYTEGYYFPGVIRCKV